VATPHDGFASGNQDSKLWLTKAQCKLSS